MNGFAIALVFLLFINVFVNLMRHGQVEEKRFDFFVSIVSCAINYWLMSNAIWTN